MDIETGTVVPKSKLELELELELGTAAVGCDLRAPKFKSRTRLTHL